MQTKEDLNAMTLVQLHNICRLRGLSPTTWDKEKLMALILGGNLVDQLPVWFACFLDSLEHSRVPSCSLNPSLFSSTKGVYLVVPLVR